MVSDTRKKMSLILRVGWVWTLEINVTIFSVTNWAGRVGLNPNMYDVILFSLFYFELFPNRNFGVKSMLCFTWPTKVRYQNPGYAQYCQAPGPSLDQPGP